MKYFNWVYRPDDFHPDYSRSASVNMEVCYGTLLNDFGYTLRLLPVQSLVPTNVDGPGLWFNGENLLQRRGVFQVDDFSWDPQSTALLQSISRAVEASDSLLLNSSFSGPSYLTTDKLAATTHAASCGVPTPRTIGVPFGRFARSVLPHVVRELGNGPYVVKPRDLSMGTSVLKVESYLDLPSVLDLVAQSGVGYVIQRFLTNSGDLRVFVMNGSVVGSLSRTPPEGGYIANGSQGGHVTSGVAELAAEESSLLLARTVDAKAICIDWLLTDDGPVFSEWMSGFGGFAALGSSERSLDFPAQKRIANAFFSWVGDQILLV